MQNSNLQKVDDYKSELSKKEHRGTISVSSPISEHASKENQTFYKGQIEFYGGTNIELRLDVSTAVQNPLTQIQTHLSRSIKENVDFMAKYWSDVIRVAKTEAAFVQVESSFGTFHGTEWSFCWYLSRSVW